MEWLGPLLTIVFIDLMLAGDNAIVIALAARNLPKHQQKKAVIWGTFGAIAIRIVATVLVVKLLDIPWLHLAGGLLLVWIAYKLLVQEESSHDNIKAGSTLGQAIGTIVLADAAMGIDNVLAVAGASHGNIWLVIAGLIISIPIVVWGSTLFIRLIERFSWILYVGAAILGYTAGHMITGEKKIAHLFGNGGMPEWLFIGLVVALIVGAGILTKAIRKNKQPAHRERETH
ncbi:TerC family protein [Paenibacillus sp. B01]|uniref:TerC family protein n=1 Tax=Paenibacillus sp. B01 TaxID=2660554 RepID=UPI00129A704A|nr:TerC family protein [Paenibacillus sp. B01]QGG56920.1 YjbE family putative metal transport protein [Paenibacillus sp. B01]